MAANSSIRGAQRLMILLLNDFSLLLTFFTIKFFDCLYGNDIYGIIDTMKRHIHNLLNANVFARLLKNYTETKLFV